MAHELNIGTFSGRTLEELLAINYGTVKTEFGVSYRYNKEFELSLNGGAKPSALINKTYTFPLNEFADTCQGTNGVAKRYQLKLSYGSYSAGNTWGGSDKDIKLTWEITCFGETFNYQTGLMNYHTDGIIKITIVRNLPAEYSKNGYVTMTDCVMKITNCVDENGRNNQSFIHEDNNYSQDIYLALSFDVYN